MSDRDELKIIVLAHIRRFFKDEAGFHNHCSQKEELLYHHVWDGGNIQKKNTLVNHKSSEEENSTAMSEDLQCQN
jgi:hypothetical protein